MNSDLLNQVTLAAFVAAIFINWRAILFAGLHLSAIWLFDSVESEIYYMLLTGVINALAGAIFIKLSYELRQVLLAIGALFWLCAVDAYLFPTTETVLYNSYIYIISAMDLYVLFLLLRGGGGNGGLFSLLERWILFLRYRILWLSYNRYK